MARKSRKNQNASPVSTEPTIRTASIPTALYARLSVENFQKKEADSIGTQIQMLRDHVSQISDLTVYDIYCDDNITGTNFNRPEFSRMMNDVRDGKVKCIVVKDLSRLGRNFLESGEYLEKVFPFLGVRFIAINDRIDTFQRPIDIGAQLKNMANEMYAKDISRKICSVMDALKDEGKFIGGHPPYGYLRHPDDKYRLIIDQQVAGYVRKAYQLVLEGYTVRAITLMLNEQGIPSPGRYKYELGLLKSEKFRNSLWSFTSMRKLLSDPVYIGWIQNGKYESKFAEGGEKYNKIPKAEWKTYKGMHDPIIEYEVFEQVQMLLGGKERPGSNVGRCNNKGNQENILRGKLRCGECGKAMAIRHRKSHGKVLVQYICPMHEHFNSSYCSKKGLDKNKFDDLLLTIIRKKMSLYCDARSLLISMNSKKANQSKYEIYQKQIQQTESRIARLMEKRTELYQRYAERAVSEERYIADSQIYCRQVDELRIFLAELEKDVRRFEIHRDGDEQWERLINQYQISQFLTREMVEAFLKSITVFENGYVEVEFNFTDEFEAILLQANQRKREERRYA